MGQDCPNSKIERRYHWEYEFEASEGYNAFAGLEFVLLNLDVISEDDIAGITDTEEFNERYAK